MARPCSPTFRWDGLALVRHLARFQGWSIIRPEAQAPHRRRSRLSSNVRARSHWSAEMKRLLAVLSLLSASWSVYPAPRLIANCEAPKGTNVQFGSYARERMQADSAGTPEPAPRLTPAVPDGFTHLPTFTLHSSGKSLKVAWSETLGDAQAHRRNFELGVPSCCNPPSPTNARVVTLSPAYVSAVESTAHGATSLYSLYPNLGVAFISVHAPDATGKSVRQYSMVAVCKFSKP